jgi:Domain of unknown function (DUF4145)
MSMLVADCPRCNSKGITFEVMAQVYRGQHYNWQDWFEIFCKCRACLCPTIFLVNVAKIDFKEQFSQPDALVKCSVALNRFFTIDRFISLRDAISKNPPEHLPDEIENAFREGAACLSIGCNNAAATMFRLCVDLGTRPFLPPKAEDGTKSASAPNEKQRRDLGLRLDWLFNNAKIPDSLRDLSKCIHQDGNDGAHAGNLTKEDAEDLLDFTTILLERLFTEPRRLGLAAERRTGRRKS